MPKVKKGMGKKRGPIPFKPDPDPSNATTKRRKKEVASGSTAKAAAESAFTIQLSKEERKRRSERKSRFQTMPKLTATTTTVAQIDPLYRPLSSERSNNSNNDEGKASAAIVGRNENLEKPYLRLTTFPDPDQVRPLSVLVKALAHIKNKYLATEDFEWANEQLKSVRQDLTVQQIRNRFVLEVYETHARILLEHGDLNEFNQCQTMIRSLCGEGSAGDQKEQPDDQEDAPRVVLEQTKEAADEFAGYALLYALVRNSWLELNQALQRPLDLAKKPPHPQKKQRLTATAAQDGETPRPRSSSLGLYPCKDTPEHATSRPSASPRFTSYQHAMCVVRAVVDDDFKTFFRLYDNAPHMSAYIMDFLVKRVRQAAYLRTIASYRPHIGVEQFREWLCFADLEQTRQFLYQQGAVFVEKDGCNLPKFWVDCRASQQKQQEEQEERSLAHRSSSSSLSEDGDDSEQAAQE